MAEALDFIAIYERLKTVFKTATDADLARKLGVTPQSLNDYKRRSKFPADLLIEVCRKKNLSADWLFFGIDTHPASFSIRGDKREYVREFAELSMRPESALAGLMRRGMKTRGEMLFIADLLYRTWELHKSVTHAWAINAVKAIFFLEKRYNPNADVNALIPENYLSATDASIVAMKLSEFLSADDFSLNNKDIAYLKSLLEPWCFYVARRTLSKEQPPIEIDTSLLLMSDDEISKAPISAILPEDITDDTKVSVQFYFSFDPAQSFSNNFSCGFTFRDETKRTLTVACDALGLFELNKALEMISPNVMTGIASGDYGSWEILINIKENLYSIRSGKTMFFVTSQEFKEFSKLAKDLYNNPYVQRNVMKDFAETYGAV